MAGRKLYGLALLACIAGYLWVGWNFSFEDTGHRSVCLIKNATGLPCPSCGSTRAVVAIANGNFDQALWYNPFGYILAVFLIGLPGWIAFDLIAKKSSLQRFYLQLNKISGKKTVALTFIVVILANWLWNLYKHV